MKGLRIRNNLIKLLLTLSTCAALAATCTNDSLKLGCILVRQVYRMTFIIQFILALSFVSGWGFIIAAIFKFKQVRENPQQVPVSTPFAFLLTAMLLIFMPGLMRFGGETLFVHIEHTGRVAIDGRELGPGSLNFLLDTVTIQRDNSSLGTDSTIFGMARRTTDMFPTLTDVIINCAYIAGLGFAIAGLFKMKSVRDNPQQNTIAGPISYLIVSILLIYMPDIISPTSQTLFGRTSSAQYEGGGAGQNFTTLIDTSII